MSISGEIARELVRLFPSECKVIEIEMLHTKAVRKYVMGIEKAHKRAAKSKLQFGYQ